MPFKSQAQRRYLYSQHPDVAAKFQAETPRGMKIPEKVKKVGLVGPDRYKGK